MKPGFFVSFMAATPIFSHIYWHTSAVCENLYSEGNYKMRTDDGYIIYECLNEKSEAFGILVDKYKAGIYAYVYAELGNFQDAQDVTQEVFLQAYRSLRNLRRWESFGSWLYRIARNLSRKWIQAESRRPDREFIEDQTSEALENNSINSYRKSQVKESLQEALRLLPETYREALTLYYFGGMNSVDIAKALGTSPTAVRHRLSRARARLKEEMVAMMDTAFEGQRLQASFTFRVVEAVKRIKIHPMPRTAGVPWGLSLAAGIIITILSLNPHLKINPASVLMNSPRPVEARVLETGEISVEILKTSRISVMSGKRDDGNGGELLFQTLQNTLFLAPPAGGGTWTEKADMPTGRMHLCASAVNGKIYAIGGGHMVGEFEQALSAVEEYDPATDKWEKRADMRKVAYYLSSSVVDGKIYAIGGGGPGDCVVEEYDPAKDKWTKKADMPTRRGDLSISAVNGKIYAMGGWDGNEIVSTVEEYDPAVDLWTEIKKADMLTPRGGFSTSVVNGKIYAIGGSTGKMYASAVEEYDPVTDTWTRKANIPTTRTGLSTSVVNGKIYAIGGWGWGGTDLPSVEEYDPATDKWTRKANMPTARGVLATSMMNGKIYAIGGYRNELHLSAVEEYDPSSIGVETMGKLPTKWGEVKQR